MKPLVAIVGRPNVGKSTFFNKIVGRRISIVNDMPGVTRDRVYADTEWCGYNFTFIDTGGIEPKSDDVMWSHIREQAEIAVETAQVILFFVDGKAGLTGADREIANFLRKSKKPVILVVNKLDNNETEKTFEFYELGFDALIGISSEHSKGFGDLMDEIVGYFDEKAEDDDSEYLKIAVVGKPNAGKSSLVNRLLGFKRTIVSDIAGTTRDAIDTRFELGGKHYTLIDTAGIRRKRSIDDETVESYSVMRSLGAIRRADVVLIVLDATEEVSEQDVRIAGYTHEQGKPSVIVMNKWDLIEKDTHTVNKYNDRLKVQLAFMDYFQPIYVSALTGKRADKVLAEAERVYENASRRIATGTLNDVINEAISVNEPPTRKGRQLKILYATQAASNPPTFVLFVNDSELMHFSYVRYLENSLRKAFDFGGTPVKIIVRNRNEE